jgi:hypothetical protein
MVVIVGVGGMHLNPFAREVEDVAEYVCEK